MRTPKLSIINYQLSIRSAFSLMEVLAAIAIFALGMIAAASLYPAALSIQKQTVVDVQTTQAKHNARAVLKASKIILSNDKDISQFPFVASGDTSGLTRSGASLYDGSFTTNSGKTPKADVVFPFDKYFFAESNANYNAWTYHDLAYPDIGIKDKGNASLYWVPFFSYTDSNTVGFFSKEDKKNITIYVALLKAQHSKKYSFNINNNTYYPNEDDGNVDGSDNIIPVMMHIKVNRGSDFNKIQINDTSDLPYNLSDMLHANDTILDNRGNIYKVQRIIKPDTIVVKGIVPRHSSTSPKHLAFIWMGVPYAAGGDNPVKDIFLIKGGEAVHYDGS